MLDNPEFWVGVAFVLFAGLLVWKGVPALVGKSIDERAAGIRKELDEARKLKEEAHALLADYQQRKNAAAAEAETIIDAAKREATALAAEARVSLAENLERRTRLAEEKIARAEAQATAEVRAAAIEAAIGASERIIGAKLGPDAASILVDGSIKDVKVRLG